MSVFAQPHSQSCHKCHAANCNYQIVKPTDVFDELLLRKHKQTSWKTLVLSIADGKIMSYCSSCSTSKRTRRCAWAICLVSCCCSCHDNLIKTSILWLLFDQFPVSLTMFSVAESQSLSQHALGERMRRGQVCRQGHLAPFMIKTSKKYISIPKQGFPRWTWMQYWL